MVRVAIHQPNYLPYQGYFHKIFHCDRFVFMDQVQFPQGRSYCYRNRVKTSSGPVWLSVPTQHRGRRARISEVRIDNEQNWSEKHLQTIYHAYSRAPHFESLMPVLEEALSRPWERLAELNMRLIELLCRYMGMTDADRFIRMSDIEGEGRSTDLLIDICRKVGGDIYLSGVSGKKYIVEEAFEKAGVELVYSDFKQPGYPQLWSEEFIPNLSILDILFNCGPESAEIIRRGSA